MKTPPRWTPTTALHFLSLIAAGAALPVGRPAAADCAPAAAGCIACRRPAQRWRLLFPCCRLRRGDCASGRNIPKRDFGPARPPAAPKWQSLFDGKSLDGWKITNFGGEGDVTVQDGKMVLDFGYSLTGVTYGREFPKMDYEVSLEAMRMDGIDFFCALTFRVAESHCTLVVGGWAGAVVGLSSIDGRDASENETTRYMSFKDGQWYRIRVRVAQDKIQAWIDDEQVVDQNTKGRRIDTRIEVELSRPFGICAWETKAALRNIRVRKL